jgi:hypothetical protein
VAVSFRPGSGGVLYVNGVEVGRNPYMVVSPADMSRTADNWIGRAREGSAPYFSGRIDELRVYERALTANQVAAFYATRIQPTAEQALKFWTTIPVFDQLSVLEVWNFRRLPTYDSDLNLLVQNIDAHIQGMAKLPDDAFVLTNSYRVGSATEDYLVVWDPRSESLYRTNFSHESGWMGGADAAGNLVVVGIGGGGSIEFFVYSRDANDRPVLTQAPDLKPDGGAGCGQEFPALAYHEGHQRYYLFACEKLFRARVTGLDAINEIYAQGDFWEELTENDANVWGGIKGMPGAEGGSALLYDRATDSLVWLNLSSGEVGENRVHGRVVKFASPPERTWETEDLGTDNWNWYPLTDMLTGFGPSTRWAATVYLESDGRVSFALSQRNLDSIGGGQLSWAPYVVTIGVPGNGVFERLTNPLYGLQIGVNALGGLYNRLGELVLDEVLTPAAEAIDDCLDDPVACAEDVGEEILSWLGL